MPLVDTNVLFGLVTDDPIWAEWSFRQLRIQALKDRLMIDSVVYAELSVGFDRLDQVDAFLDRTDIEVDDVPRAALFLAGKPFRSTGLAVVRGRVCCPISSSARMPLFRA